MFEKLSKVIQNQELFTKKDMLLVGVSGGIDSMVLCHLLYKSGYSFIIAHCNYHLRGLESDLDEQLVKSWANEHDIPFFTKSCSLIKKNNIQEEARKIRYSYFNELKNKENCKYILTAHHGNDQVETFFNNLSRGAGIKGLQGIQKKRADLIRPLLGVSKNNIYNYAISQQIQYREDQTNQKVDYLRNFFRNEVIPIISNRIPAFFEMALRSISHLSELAMFADQIYLEWKNENVKENSNELKITKPAIEKFYFISNLLVELGFHPETILQIKKNYKKVGIVFTDKNKHELLLDRDFVFIRKMNLEQDTLNYELSADSGELNVGNYTIQWIMKKQNGIYSELPGTSNVAFFDYKSLQFPLFLRKWMPGDTIKPLGMKGKTKKIQDVLTNCKVSVFEKETIYVLFSGKDVLWIPGFMRSEIATIAEHTQSYIQISWNHSGKQL